MYTHIHIYTHTYTQHLHYHYHNRPRPPTLQSRRCTRWQYCLKVLPRRFTSVAPFQLPIII